MTNIRENFKYYTPTSREEFGHETEKPAIEVPASGAVRKLTSRLLDQFSANKITVFHGGEPLQSPRASGNNTQFERELIDVTVDRCRNLLTENGKINEGQSQAWTNVTEIAPFVLGAFLNRANFIESVNRSQALNLVGFSLDVARRPDILADTTIITGFGGSDDAFTSTRLPAYALPSLKIIRDLNAFYQDREKRAILKEAREKLFRDLSHGEDKSAFSSEERRRIFQRVDETLGDKDFKLIDKGSPSGEAALFDARALAALQSKYGIAERMPTVELLFASEAAIAINHRMDPGKVSRRRMDNLAILRRMIEEEYRDVAPNVRYVNDLPWAKRKLYARLQIEYLALLLKTSDKDSIKKTIELMERLGDSHGGENGKLQSTEYAASHPLLFLDRLNLPGTPVKEGVGQKPKVIITIGGSTERQFNAIREELAQRANPDDLKDFIKTKAKESGNPTELEQTLRRINLWQEVVDGGRRKYEDENAYIVPPDRPYTSIQLITSIGRTPTYYVVDGLDQPHGSDIEAQLALLKDQRKEAGHDTDGLRLRSQIDAVIHDLEAIKKETGGK